MADTTIAFLRMRWPSIWQNHIKPLLLFSRGERQGIVCLCVIVFLAWRLPRWFSPRPRPLAAAEWQLIDSARSRYDRDSQARTSRYRTNGKNTYQRDRSLEKPPSASRLYRPFDPNQADEATWLAMGISARTVSTIKRYLAAGGRFRQPDDLRRIYGIRDQDYQAIRSWVRIRTDSIVAGRPKGDRPPNFPSPVQDINAMDSVDWDRLPGIGPVLARRILRFRDGLGGFGSVDQLGEVYGIRDSLLQALKPRLSVAPGFQPPGLSLNEAGPEVLEQHPYLGKRLARLIVAYRQQHGPFARLEDLQAIPLVDSVLLNKLRPYLRLN